MTEKTTVDNELKPALSEEISESWTQVKKILARELSDQSYKTWFEPLNCLELTQTHITIGVPDSYFGKWLKDHYSDLIISAVRETCHSSVEVRFQVQEKIQPKPLPNNKIESSPVSHASPRQPAVSLNQKYTFDDFVVGPGNRFAHAAAMAISEAPARQYNPLFIHGSVGLGKTHLMQSIAHAMKRNFPDSRILYISSEKFTNQLISAIQTRSTKQFREKYRGLDLLLIDDIHFIAEKEATQEEFFHTFNTLYDAHKQIVISSDRPPKDIPGLEERLVSRFGWGLVTDIQPPDFETRVAILKKKMEKETVTVSDDICFYIATKIKSNVRELEGALIRVAAYCQLTGSPLTVETAQSVLKDSIREEEEKISIDKIQRIVASFFHLKVSDLRAKTRTKSVAVPRQIAMYLIRQMTSHSLPEIGEYFGGRDHTTVLHACQKIAKATAQDEKTGRTVRELEELIKRG